MSVAAAALPASLVPPGSTAFTPPQIDWVAAAPVVTVLGAAVVGVLVEAFVPRAARRATQLVLAGVGLLASLSFVVWMWEKDETRAVVASTLDPNHLGMQQDKVALFLQGTLLVLTALALLVLGERGGGRLESFAAQAATTPGSDEERLANEAGRQSTEVFPLTMFAAGGMMIFSSAQDLLTMFVALEVFSLPLYIMCGLARRRRLLSQEASLKYFLLGAFSSAIFLFGMAIVYAITGTVTINGMGATLAGARQAGIDLTAQYPFLVAGILLVLVGLLFKVGAAPFHAWTPDVYTGAPTPVTGFMAACTKVAAFGALVRLLYVSLANVEEILQPALWAVAALTMVIGSLVAIRQLDVKRMLAYSSIAHAGFILTGLVTVQEAGIVGVLFYVLAYGLTTVAAFGIVTLVRSLDEDGNDVGEATHLSQWAGLGRRSPVLAAAFTFLLLAMAGIPLTSGFIAKVGVFSAAVTGGVAWLAVLGVLASAAAAFFYLRVVVLMYFTEPSTESTTVVVGGWLTGTAIAVGVLATLVLGVFPQPFLDLAGAITAAP
ncbi:NADH-quinone oxidoreductase subunit NuoN [Angustibacter speluncae]